LARAATGRFCRYLLQQHRRHAGMRACMHATHPEPGGRKLPCRAWAPHACIAWVQLNSLQGLEPLAVGPAEGQRSVQLVVGQLKELQLQGGWLSAHARSSQAISGHVRLEHAMHVPHATASTRSGAGQAHCHIAGLAGSPWQRLMGQQLAGPTTKSWPAGRAV
jgi:hypothetical protein